MLHFVYMVCVPKLPLSLLLLSCALAACSTAPKTPQPLVQLEAPATAPAPSTPEQTQITAFTERAIHPDGFAISDVRALFMQPTGSGAPSLESLQHCDFDYQAETAISRNREELFITLPAHIKSDPEKYHWCFYAKILKLEDDFQNEDLFVDQRRDLLNHRYLFFVHVARVFLVDFEDPRYLEFATYNYKRLRAMLFKPAGGP